MSIHFFFYVNSLHCFLWFLLSPIASQLSQAYIHTNFLFEYLNFLKNRARIAFSEYLGAQTLKISAHDANHGDTFVVSMSVPFYPNKLWICHCCWCSQIASQLSQGHSHTNFFYLNTIRINFFFFNNNKEEHL